MLRLILSLLVPLQLAPLWSAVGGVVDGCGEEAAAESGARAGCGEPATGEDAAPSCCCIDCACCEAPTREPSAPRAPAPTRTERSLELGLNLVVALPAAAGPLRPPEPRRWSSELRRAPRGTSEVLAGLCVWRT